MYITDNIIYFLGVFINLFKNVNIHQINYLAYKMTIWGRGILPQLLEESFGLARGHPSFGFFLRFLSTLESRSKQFFLILYERV